MSLFDEVFGKQHGEQPTAGPVSFSAEWRAENARAAIMLQRDTFAEIALERLIQRSDRLGATTFAADVAKQAFEIADAMMKARG